MILRIFVGKKKSVTTIEKIIEKITRVRNFNFNFSIQVKIKNIILIDLNYKKPHWFKSLKSSALFT